MSETQQQNYISLAIAIFVSLPYFFYIYTRYMSETFASTDAELVFWANAVLLVIPVRIIAQIIFTIIAYVIRAAATGRDDELQNDERDNLIELRSNRNSYIGFAIGMLLGFIALAAGQSVAVFFTILLVSGTLSEFVEIGSKIYYYTYE